MSDLPAACQQYPSVVDKVKAKAEPEIDPFAGMAGGTAVSAKAARAGGRGMLCYVVMLLHCYNIVYDSLCQVRHFFIHSFMRLTHRSVSFWSVSRRKSCAASETHDDLSWSLIKASFVSFEWHDAMTADDVTYLPSGKKILNNSFDPSFYYNPLCYFGISRSLFFCYCCCCCCSLSFLRQRMRLSKISWWW